MGVGGGGTQIECPRAETQYSNFAIEYRRENKTFRETVLACLKWFQVQCFDPKGADNL